MPALRNESKASNYTVNSEHYITYSNTQADSLRFSYSLTTGATMTLKRFELVEQCEEVLLVANVLNSQDYYPFGMVMPGRSYQGADDYRYGFQGQEQDDEIKGDGNSINYKYRMHDPRIGRFFSVDPLAAKYPYYSQYAFSGNRVIDAVEIEGLEPSKNTPITSPDENFKAAAADVCVINDQCQISNGQVNGQDNTRQAGGLQLDGTMTNTPVTGGLSSKTEDGATYVSDTQAESAENYNMWVNAGSTFVVDESQASGMNDYNLFVTTVLLNNFATGQGPENYVFPENGIVSSMMKNSIIVQNALTEFRAGEANSSVAQYSFGLGDLASNVGSFMTPFNVEGFVGSGTITMVKTETSIKVTVFNITSLYSGAYTAKTGATSYSPPTSNVRDPNSSSNTYFGNISQTFSFTVPLIQ